MKQPSDSVVEASPSSLAATAAKLFADGRGILAMDESTATCNARFAALAIEQTETSRRDWRELILTTPGLSDCIGGAILFDETIRQRTSDGTPFVELMVAAGIVPGIKVDLGTVPLSGHPDEKMTEGLDGLSQRLSGYVDFGARFAKWRAVIACGDPGRSIPTRACISANAHTLALYAAMCQEAGLVPIVEPEVLMDGDHTLERCRQVTEDVLVEVFERLRVYDVSLEGLILKPAMVLPGSKCSEQNGIDEVAAVTVQTLLRCVPAAVAGVAFLSGGQSAVLASARLNAMHLHARDTALAWPWPLGFSYSRAVQQPALERWRGDPRQRDAAQEILLHRARCNRAARRGEYHRARDAVIID